LLLVIKVVFMKVLESPEEIRKGLMGWKEGEVVLVLPKESRFGAAVHTFFCKPMLIAWLDKNKKVISYVKAKPWRIYFPPKKAKYVYENTDLRKTLKVGEKIEF
jgi:uncharacterized membrane protein (UPF0127 family)